MEKPKRKSDWEGRYVKLLSPIETMGGCIFPEGTVMRVTRNHGGLHLEAVLVCKGCRSMHRWKVKGISEFRVELLPQDFIPQPHYRESPILEISHE